ncbi:MAG TPA: phosphatase PAP2 family protein, partial [Reyranella sp.]|nr:phosphatase PAP2 family protein [Reyranella sp.]
SDGGDVVRDFITGVDRIGAGQGFGLGFSGILPSSMFVAAAGLPGSFASNGPVFFFETVGRNLWFDPTGGLSDDITVVAGFETGAPVASDIVVSGIDQAPALTAGLVNDTGTSATDGLTNDPTIQGLLTTPLGFGSLRAGLDGTTSANYTDLAALLQPNGSFTLSPGLLTQMAGGILADGPHTLHLLATDAQGNIAASGVTFTLKASAPAAPTVGLAPTDVFGDPANHQTQSATVTLVGQADAGNTLTLTVGGIVSGITIASNTGTFQFANVALALGTNNVTVTSADGAGSSSASGLAIERIARQAGANAVLAWNQIMLDAIRTDASSPPTATRGMAMEGLAVLDALNAINGTPGYLVRMSAPAGASADAAVAAAAHKILTYLYPGQTAALDAKFATALAAITDGTGKTDGIALGEAVANQVIALRANDGWNDFAAFEGGNDVGEWRPTAPMYDFGLQPQWADLTPFALTSPDQFLPQPPPSLTSQQYAADLTKTQSLGKIDSSTRTADQTQIARFWADGAGTYTPPGAWAQIAQEVAQAQGLSVAQTARLMAQLNVALADAAIACWDSKYYYDAWRPDTAIQNADLDGNPGTILDAGWQPLLISPPFPEYVSGHSTFSAAAAAILTSVFGDNYAFSTTSTSLLGVTRNFTSFTQAAQEAGESRIYGGIHFEFSNQAGQTLGAEVAAQALKSFDLAQDTIAPKIQFNQASGLVASQSPTITGFVTDNLSGVASLQLQVDGGFPSSVPIGANGAFSISPDLAIDGSADGQHILSLVATDARGNASDPLAFTFTLDTRAPILTPANGSVVDGSIVAGGARLTGTADPTGSTLASLTYQFAGDALIPIAFDSTVIPSYDVELDLARLDVGPHVLTVTARDAAGNQLVSTLNVTVPQLVPLTVTGLTPIDGAVDVGVTYRPQVTFSRAVNTSTLTSESFFATDSAGNALAANIVPTADRMAAWLFFGAQMPSASTITLHVLGDKIRGAADGTFLDAAGNGTAGSELTASFTTVSTTVVPGTVLQGKVLDPGPDLQPMTFDDTRAGPDGSLHTADDVYLLPLAGVKVWILGRENEAVFTDAQGSFTLTNVPSGDVKVALDGRTATNAPAGFYFPEMVMDSNIKPGILNTLMGSMGDDAEQAANQDYPAVYLPRLQQLILSNISTTEPTTVTAPLSSSSGSGSNLTGEQLGQLSLTVQPGSLVDANGNPVTNATVGISTVPASLVRDMLPPGLLQHTFDITIQTPDSVAFTTPAVLTMPNVFNAPPGTKLNVLSFDHTTGRLVIDGTATVSADGKTVTTDPGQGVTMPGWHGMTPPGSTPDTPPPPCPPVPAVPTLPPAPAIPHVLPLLSGDTPTPLGLNGFSVSAPPTGYVRSVSVTVDPQISNVFDDVGTGRNHVPVTGGAFTLRAGDAPVTFNWKGTPNGILDLLGMLNDFSIQGGVVTIDVVTQKSGDDHAPDGECPPPPEPPTQSSDKFFLYRYLNPVFATQDIWQSFLASEVTPSNVLPFNDAVIAGPGGSDQIEILKMNISAEAAVTPSIVGGAQYFATGLSTGSVGLVFTPTAEGKQTDQLQLRPGVTLNLAGLGQKRQVLYFDHDSLKSVLIDIRDHTGLAAPANYTYVVSAAAATALSAANIEATITAIFDQAKAFYVNAVGGAIDVQYGTGNDGNRAVWTNIFIAGGSGGNAGSPYGSGIDALDTIMKVVANKPALGDAATRYLLPQAINQSLPGTASIFLLNAILGNNQAFTATTIAHELGHTLGLTHLSGGAGAAYNIQVPAAGHLADVMAYNYGSAPALNENAFDVTLPALQLALNQLVTSVRVTDAFKYYKNAKDTGGAGTGENINTGVDSDDLSNLFGQYFIVSEVTTGNPAEIVDFGNQILVGSDATRNFLVESFGSDPVTIESATISGSLDFSLVLPDDFQGMSLAQGEEAQFGIKYTPNLGPAQATITITTDAGTQQFYVTGQGTVAGAGIAADIGDNNLGGAVIGQSVSKADAIVLHNYGQSPLTISGVNFIYGGTSFQVNGLPADLA